MPRTRQRVMLKFRVVVKQPMTKSRAFKLLRRSLDTGVLQDGIEIMAMDWKSGSGARWSRGEIPSDDLEEMRAFFNMVRHSNVRAEKVG